ncbi:Gfo/Idh/MocA family protein [Paenibacillus oceani]|jgi:predicted dehydrogenase|uniref:Gfo/Idh/MocA family oxidoreductase n=1 Tax=Paenibacillus oceani TaxID=2772510 RepID=A0A927CEL9_9BACL|nr:Gfo/Idh/MocA family oxidoreductase [Paenibacillus oceani]MBD2865497.1 Gfo/Idh/MocA family oxidoreductase [Paenibacillus oceani]
MGLLRFVVVGTGWVAGEYLKAISSRSDAEVATVVSRNTEHAKAKLASMGIQARVTDNFEEAVKDSSVDAVVLCSTPDSRPEQAVIAARYGKHLVMEKPLAMDRAGLWSMAEAIEKNPVKTAVSFVLRWNPSFTNTKSLIDDDAIGRVYMAQVDYWHHVGPKYVQYKWSKTKAQGGSSMLSAGCHAVDAVRFFAGDITEVTAYGCRTWADSEYEFDPNAIAILKLKNGGIGKVSSSLECKTPYKFNVHLLGEKGAIMNNQLFTHKLPGQTDYATIPTILPDSGDVSHHPFTDEIDDFVQAVRNNTATKCEFADAYKSMEVSFAIDESIETGKSVILPLAR